MTLSHGCQHIPAYMLRYLGRWLKQNQLQSEQDARHGSRNSEKPSTTKTVSGLPAVKSTCQQ